MTRVAGRQRDTRTDGLLVDAVLDLVNQGATLSGLSFVAIAERAGVSRNTLYRRWRTKDSLYLDVLASLHRPLPPLDGPDARTEVTTLLTAMVEWALDARGAQMVRALSAEAVAFPQLLRRYFEEVVAPRRAAMLSSLARGVAAGEIGEHVNLELAADLLVDPILVSVFSSRTDHLDRLTTAPRITELVFAGLQPR
ncbi:MAG: hypothetical protein JWL70_2281 [Acidimicrobiia bacterium]|nr:hypothetical protein [Acidimicrobiia bacterium]